MWPNLHEQPGCGVNKHTSEERSEMGLRTSVDDMARHFAISDR
jgi:hypothetical protein